MTSLSRAERLLQKWANNPSCGLTPAGKDWLIAALDPFHDSLLKNLQGWPDVETAPSVVRCIKQSITISASSGGGPVPAVPWDAMITLYPFFNAQDFIPTSAQNNGVFSYIAGTGSTGQIGGLHCRGNFVSGSDFDYTSNVPSRDLGYMRVADPFTRGMGRLVGVGFEVVDTTADLYKQGSLAVWKMPQNPRESSVYRGIDQSTPNSINDYTFAGTPLRLPPVNLAEAMLFQGSKQWYAKEGAYVVATFHSNENPPYSADYIQPVLYSGTLDIAEEGPNVQKFYVPYPDSFNFGTRTTSTIPPISFSSATAAGQHLNPIHTSGVLLSGLNPLSTFTINMNVFYESFPGITEQDILVMATPSAEFDPVALNLYSHAMSLMPPGVKVAENATGDWFFDVISRLSKIAAPILSAIPHPIAQVASGVVKEIGTNLSGMDTSGKLPKKKKVKVNNQQLAQGARGPKGKIQGPLRQAG